MNLHCIVLIFQLSFQQLSILVDSLQKEPVFRSAVISVSVRNMTTNEIMYQHAGYQAVNSASTLKLVSTGVATSILGSNFVFKTRLEYSGTIENNVLKGNLYIVGGGDPSFGSNRFGSTLDIQLKAILNTIKRLGIRKIEGYIVADGSIYSSKSIPDSWIWGDLGNYYGATAQALNINENEYEIYFSQKGNIGSQPEIIKVNPALEYLSFRNEVSLADKNSDDETMIYASPFSNEILIRGTIPQGNGSFKVKGSILNPSLATASLFQNYLKNDSIVCTQNPTTLEKMRNDGQFDFKQRYFIEEFSSPSLQTMLKPTNFESLNLYADAFLKAAMFQKSRSSNAEDVAKSLKIYCQNKGIDVTGFEPKDGSGLSPSGLISGNFMTDFLAKMSFEPDFVVFKNSIPVVGVSGTVKNLCKKSIAEGKIYAKSGSIEGTRAYAGYFEKNGINYSFSAIISHYESGQQKIAREALEKIMISFFKN